MHLEARLESVAEELGCTAFGITTAAPFAGVAESLRERQRNGHKGMLRFTYKDPDLAADVRRSFPWAERIVTVSWPYLPQAGNPGPPAGLSGRIARFATEDHYEGLRTALQAIVAALVGDGWRAEPVWDDDRLVDRAAAVRSGIGWWGKSTMVLDPRNGPWTLLGSVITDAPLNTTTVMRRDCGTCDACIPACPTGAIIAPGVLDAGRCIAHWTQMKGVIPAEIRIPMGDRIYGCDDCLDACPPGDKRLRDSDLVTGRLDLIELLEADDATILAKHAHFYLPRRNPRFLRRNALVALGNTASSTGGADQRDDAVEVLGRHLVHPDDLYRLHAAWALGRIGGADCVAKLEEQLSRESREDVAEEIVAALAAASTDSGPAVSTLLGREVAQSEERTES